MSCPRINGSGRSLLILLLLADVVRIGFRTAAVMVLAGSGRGFRLNIRRLGMLVRMGYDCFRSPLVVVRIRFVAGRSLRHRGNGQELQCDYYRYCRACRHVSVS